jgi:hypothetical protein
MSVPVTVERHVVQCRAEVSGGVEIPQLVLFRSTFLPIHDDMSTRSRASFLNVDDLVVEQTDDEEFASAVAATATRIAGSRRIRRY